MTDLRLPKPPAPAGSYVPVIVRNGIGFVSGQFPMKDGLLMSKGRVGVELNTDQAKEACYLAGLNVLAQIKVATDGFKDLEGLLRLEGYVASSDCFHSQPEILDAASALFVEVLGSRGRHSRTAFSVHRLPLNSSIELCVSFCMR